MALTRALTRPLLVMPLLALLTLLLIGCAGGPQNTRPADSFSAGARIDDADLELNLRRALNDADDRFRDTRINVVSVNGRVLLAGFVPTADMIATATDVARGFNRLDILHNELTVNATPDLDVRAADQWISVRVKGRLIFERGLPARQITVTTHDGTVYLMGVVTSEVAERAQRIAAGVEGAQRIVSIFERSNGA